MLAVGMSPTAARFRHTIDEVKDKEDETKGVETHIRTFGSWRDSQDSEERYMFHHT
jgi:hypothetical protein